MKSKISLLIFLIFLTSTVHSQIKFGIKAGLNVASIKSDDLTINKSTLESVSNSVVGYHFGLVGQLSLFGFYLQPELILTRTGGQIKFTDSLSVSKLIDQKFTRLDIPVIFGKKYGPVRLGLGPVFSTILSSKSELSDIQGYDDRFNKATLGYQLNLGLDLWKIGLDVKYEGNLSKLGSGVKLFGTQHSFDSRQRQFLFSISYYF
jgi:hypothetical protein